MTEHRDIGWRLENWGRWCSSDFPRQGLSQTGAICDRMRKATEGAASTSADRQPIDEDDAWRIERAMPDIEEQHRMLLWWCYIRNAQPELICRKMGIPHRPHTEFVERFRAAQAAIEAIADKREEVDHAA